MRYNQKSIITRIKEYEAENRFLHTCSMADMAVSLAECYKLDTEITWITAMLHDIAKNLTIDEMKNVADKYNYKISELSFRYPQNMHAEIGTLIAENEFGLKDRNALNAIKYHVSARPDMSLLEKIIFFSDWAEPTRPNYTVMQYLYRVARTDIDKAILRGLRILIEYQEKHEISRDICELCTNAFDFLIEEMMIKNTENEDNSSFSPEMLTDNEFDTALEVIKRNGLPIKSVKNIRCFGGFRTDSGSIVSKGKIFRSGTLANLTEEDADYLKNVVKLSLVIDLRTPEEVKKNPDVLIPGVKYKNIPLSYTLQIDRMDQLTKLYQKSETEREKAYYLAEYARINEVMQMYHNISVDKNSRDAIKNIFKLILNEEGTILFHCSSGKDRTDIISALFLYALGCKKDDIVCDYNASAVVYMALVETMKDELKEHNYNVELQASLQTILGVVPEVIAAGYCIDSNYTFNQELIMEKIGLNNEELQRLRNKFCYYSCD